MALPLYPCKDILLPLPLAQQLTFLSSLELISSIDPSEYVIYYTYIHVRMLVHGTITHH